MRRALLVATLLTAPALAHADQGYPSAPFQNAPARAAALTDPANSPITGVAIQAGIVPLDRPPSLETLMAARPGLNPEARIPEGRAATLYVEALGARAHWAAESLARQPLHTPAIDAAVNAVRTGLGEVHGAQP